MEPVFFQVIRKHRILEWKKILRNISLKLSQDINICVKKGKIRSMLNTLRNSIFFKRQEMYFVVSEQNEPLGKLDFIALENIIITLQFSLIRHVIEENLEKRHLRDLEYRMLDGSLSNDEENEVAGMLGLNDAEIYRVVTLPYGCNKRI